MVAGLDVRHVSGESPSWNAPPAAAVSRIITRLRRRARRSVVSGEFLEAPVSEKLPLEDQVAMILGEIRVLHGLDGGLDLSDEVWVFHGGDSRLDLRGELLGGGECPAGPYSAPPGGAGLPTATACVGPLPWISRRC